MNTQRNIIDTAFSWVDLDSIADIFEIAAVVDVLRATTTICTAINNGAARIIPCENKTAALDCASDLKATSDNVLLCGEIKGLPPDGFDLGNSPLEYSKEKVMNTTIVLMTTNGTKTLVKASRLALKIIVSSFSNLSAVVDFLASYNKILLVSSGRERRPSIEDIICCGMLAQRLIEKKHFSLSDATRIAINFAGSIQNEPQKAFELSEHAQYLISIGFEKDLRFCSNIDTVKVVPHLDKGIIYK